MTDQIKHYLGDDLLPICGGAGGGPNGHTQMTPVRQDVSCLDCLAVLPAPLTEETARLETIRAEDIKKGMRVKTDRTGPYFTVTMTRRNKGQQKMTITLARPGLDDLWLYPQFEEQFWYFNSADPKPIPTENILKPGTEKRVEIVQADIGWKVETLADDLVSMARLYEGKADKLHQMADQVRSQGIEWAPAGFEKIAREYAHALSHNSLGVTDGVAREIAELAGYATVLTVLFPERHQKDGD